MQNDSPQPMVTNLLKTYLDTDYSILVLEKMSKIMKPIEIHEEREKVAEYFTSLILKSETEEELLHMLTEAESGVLKTMIIRKR